MWQRQHMSTDVLMGKAGGGEEKRKYAEDINLFRLIETEKSVRHFRGEVKVF